jgi:hypothetical protein
MNGVMAYHMLRARLLVLSLVFLTAALACNHAPAGRLPVYPVRGKVLYKGNPLPGALVVFERKGEATPASSASGTPAPVHATGRVAADGTFELMTYQGNDGAPAGDYLVGISSVPPRSERGLFSSQDGPISKGNPDVLRGRFSDPKSSGLLASVKEQDNVLPPFELK